jgi:putative salt-induced outer membrane protein YdiY/preprotein translocase subunit YajC
MFKSPLRTPFSFVFALFFLAQVAHADQVVMKNGDVITGKISRVDSKEVVIDPAYTKKFAVKRSAIESIVTESVLEVELEDGAKVRARFAGLDEGMQVLEIDHSDTPVDVERMRRASVPQSWYKRESKVEGLATINEGNTDSRSAALAFDTRLRLGDHRQYARLGYRRDENEDETTKKQTRANYEYDWLFHPSWYLGATADYERDPIRGLNHRFTFGALLGHDFFDNEHLFLTIKAGAGYTDENLGGVPTSGPVGLWEMGFRYHFGGSRLELVHDHALTYQDYGANNTIIRSSTGLRMDVMWDIYATATYGFNYETEPAPGKLSKDSTLAFGLGAKF